MTDYSCSVVSRYCLGVVLETLDQSEAAAECQIMALDLEAISPIVLFTVILRLIILALLFPGTV